jgi:hypothetical protein
MIDGSEELLAEADRFEAEGYRLTFRERLQFERLLFRTARAVAQTYLQIELHGFSAADRETILRSDDSTNESREAKRCVMKSFELKVIVTLLACGEPYRIWDIAGPETGGRAAALPALCRQIRHYVQDLLDLSLVRGAHTVPN